MGLHDFDAARRERMREAEPVQFQLGGEVFDLPAVLPANPILDLAVEQTNDRTTQLAAARRFLYAIVGDQHDKLDSVLNSVADPIDVDTIEEVVMWLAKQYTGRPTERSSESPDGPQTNGQNLSPDSSDPVAVPSET